MVGSVLCSGVNVHVFSYQSVREKKQQGNWRTHALHVGDAAQAEVPSYAAGVGGEGVVVEDDGWQSG